MPNARRSRTIAAPADELWRLVSDPYHLPRWWPRVTRVEDVREGAFTEVMKTRRGKTVRADFDLVRADSDSRTVRWDQRIEGTPFAAVLSSSQTELHLAPVSAGDGAGASGTATEVTIELRQEMSGGRAAGPRGRWSGRFGLSFGARMVRRAAGATIDEALEGLERISV
ncbi:MAG: SRPBCC family protein [Solirubrobacteraceae bacterium]